MASEFTTVSPGVITREFDRTARPAETIEFGAAFIAPRKKGPAMEPVTLGDVEEDATLFGLPDKDGKDFGAYAARLYLNQATKSSRFVRVLGMSDTGVTPGFSVSGTYAILASGSEVAALIAASGTVTLEGTLTSSVDELAINIEGFGSVTASLDRNDDNYIRNVLNTNPSQHDDKKHFVYATYDYADKTPIADGAYQVATVAAADAYTDEFITGSTTTVISQPFDNTEYDLFGVGSRFAGVSANTEFKVSITNIKKSANPDTNPYGSFTVEVRAFGDNDTSKRILESFPNVNLNSDSRNYIARRIGDRYRKWNFSTEKFDEFGEYQNKSQYIYVQMSTDVEKGNAPGEALPWGFKGYERLSNGAVGGAAAFPAIPYVQNLVYKNSFTNKVYWGAEVINNTSGAINHGVPSRLKHLPSAAMLASGTTDPDFSLKYVSGAVENISGFSTSNRLTNNEVSLLSTSIAYDTGSASPKPSSSAGFSGYLSVDNIENTNLAKFTMPIYDGFDGVDITLDDPFSPEDMGSTTAYQTHAYRTALNMLSNVDEIDISELFMPGVHHSNVVDKAAEMVRDRGDTFYVLDNSGSNVDAVVSDVATRKIDNNYVATYYPWVRLFDEVNNKQVDVPPTVVMPAVLAFSDSVSFPWFAPAGLSRGGLQRFGVIEAKDKLKKEERDKLYENRINPIATFPQQGTVVWGQKTLQEQASALDRVNVRRLLLRLRKVIARIGRDLVFEPNVASTWQRFQNRVNPFLESVRQNAGVEEFRVILDQRTTTEDLIERNIMYGQILIKPTRAAETILLDFFVTDNVAGFEE